MSPFNDSVERPSVKKKPASSNPVSNLVKLTTLGLMGFGLVIANSLLPLTGGNNPQTDTVTVLLAIENSANCAGTGCIQIIAGVTEAGHIYTLSGALAVGDPRSPICEISATGSIQGSGCSLSSGVSISGVVDTAGQGLTLNGSVLALSAIHSGSTIVASSVLASSGGLIISEGGEAGDAVLILDADQGDDAVDTWTITSEATGNALTIQNSTVKLFEIDTNGNMSGQTLVLSGGTMPVQAALFNYALLGTGTSLATGAVVTAPNIMPFDGKILWMHCETDNPQTDGLTEVDAKLDGTSIFSTNVTIDALETDSEEAATPPVIDQANNSFVQGAQLTFSTPTVGGGTLLANGLSCRGVAWKEKVSLTQP